MKRGMIFAAAIAVTATMSAADVYVSLSTGKNKNAGTKEAPLKNLWKALEKAQHGDTIHVAEGSYPGKMKQNWFKIDKAVSIIGGYAPDFATRDPLKHRTLFQAQNENNSKKGSGRGVFHIEFAQKDTPTGVNMVFDGLIFDEGQANSYHAVKGKPEGVETGMWLQGPAKNPADKNPSPDRYMIYSATQNRATGNVTIKNCAFVNGGNAALQFTWYEGKVEVENCVFCNNRMVGANVLCSKPIPENGPNNPKPGWKPAVEWEFENNTVLFTWSTKNDLASMGYGVRNNTGVAADISAATT